MGKYDLTVLVTGETDADGRKKLEEKMEKLVVALNGKVGKTVEMGKKQLAYKIGGVREAAFFNWLLELPAASVVQLDKKLTVDREILRHLLVVSD